MANKENLINVKEIEHGYYGFNSDLLEIYNNFNKLLLSIKTSKYSYCQQIIEIGEDSYLIIKEEYNGYKLYYNGVNILENRSEIKLIYVNNLILLKYNNIFYNLNKEKFTISKIYDVLFDKYLIIKSEHEKYYIEGKEKIIFNSISKEIVNYGYTFKETIFLYDEENKNIYVLNKNLEIIDKINNPLNGFLVNVYGIIKIIKKFELNESDEYVSFDGDDYSEIDYVYQVDKDFKIEHDYIKKRWL